MSSIAQTLFGPLGKEYCLYFYVIEIIIFIFVLISIFKYLARAIKMRMTGWDHFAEIMDILKIGIQYFVIRLLYSMCSTSLNR